MDPITSSAFERLPLLVLDLIADHVAALERNRQTLFSFSLTSRACCRAATPQRFHNIHLSILTVSKLKADIEKWDQRLRPTNRYRHVRILKLSGMMHLENPNSHYAGYVQEHFTQQLHDYEASVLQFEQDGGTIPCQLADLHDICSPPGLLQRNIVRGRQLGDIEKEKNEKAWEPVKKFIRRLPGLADVVHACSDQLPSSLLRLLHEELPNCRLHLHTFCLGSMLRTPTDETPIDPEDLALITSPCLYGIAIPLTPWESVSIGDHGNNGFGNYRINYNNTDLVIRMITELTPNLAHVHVHARRGRRPRGSPWTARFFGTQWPKLQSFFPPGTGIPRNPKHQGKVLRSLILPWNDESSLRHNDSTNIFKAIVESGVSFARLQVLDLNEFATPETVHLLGELASAGSLPSLRSLRIHGTQDSGLSDGGSPQQEVLNRSSEVDCAAAHTIRSLPNLKRLDISDIVLKKTQRAIVGDHDD